MYFASIDCGSTNSRVYILNEKGVLLGKTFRSAGVRDTSIHGSNDYLKTNLECAFYEAVEAAGLDQRDISFVISAGMITSELGLLEVPHLWAPVTVDDLACNLQKVSDPEIFSIDLPIYFIPGVKNRYKKGNAKLSDVALLDFMRGEETQMAGLIAMDIASFPLTVAVLSSHTKFISIDKNKAIQGSVTTLSGQLYAAIVKETSIGKSVRVEGSTEGFPMDMQVVDCAYEQVRRTGLVRSLLMPRFLDTLLDTEPFQRQLFLQSAIATEDLEAMNAFELMGFPIKTNIILMGQEERCRIYSYLLKEKMGFTEDISSITESEEIDMFNIRGTLVIAQQAGLLV